MLLALSSLHIFESRCALNNFRLLIPPGTFVSHEACCSAVYSWSCCPRLVAAII